MKQFDKIEIEWLDSVMDPGWKWLNNVEKDFGSTKQLSHVSIGYFLAKTKLSIIIAQSMQEKIFADGDRSTGFRLEIPLVAVKKIRILMVGR